MKKQISELLGKKVGHIRVVDVLGEGGMGAVYVGFDDTLQRKVALKAIRSEFRLSEEARARFLREAKNAKRALEAQLDLAVSEQETRMLISWAARLEKERQFSDAIGVLEKVIETRRGRFSAGGDPVTATVFFDIGCLYARQEEPDLAIENLNLAVDNGWNDPWIEEDPELASLHGTHGFDTLVKKVRELRLSVMPPSPNDADLTEALDEAMRKAEGELLLKMEEKGAD